MTPVIFVTNVRLRAQVIEIRISECLLIFVAFSFKYDTQSYLRTSTTIPNRIYVPSIYVRSTYIMLQKELT